MAAVATVAAIGWGAARGQSASTYIAPPAPPKPRDTALGPLGTGVLAASAPPAIPAAAPSAASVDIQVNSRAAAFFSSTRTTRAVWVRMAATEAAKQGTGGSRRHATAVPSRPTGLSEFSAAPPPGRRRLTSPSRATAPERSTTSAPSRRQLRSADGGGGPNRLWRLPKQAPCRAVLRQQPARRRQISCGRPPILEHPTLVRSECRRRLSRGQPRGRPAATSHRRAHHSRLRVSSCTEGAPFPAVPPILTANKMATTTTNTPAASPPLKQPARPSYSPELPPQSRLPSARRSGTFGSSHAPALISAATHCGEREGGGQLRVCRAVSCLGSRREQEAGHDAAKARGRDGTARGGATRWKGKAGVEGRSISSSEPSLPKSAPDLPRIEGGQRWGGCGPTSSAIPLLINAAPPPSPP